MNKPKILVIVGPTASGKTSLSVDLAEHFNGEVISADSRQVYKKLDIGTAKVTEEETKGIPHHLIDMVDINTTYTVSDFKADASVSITRILNRNKLPVIAGGTFFYIDALLGKTPISEVPPNNSLRKELAKKETIYLYEALKKLDPRRAHEIDPKNKRRLIRALEIIAEMGAVPPKKISISPYDVLTIGIKTNKSDLRENFKQRAKLWLENGFKEEVINLLELGVNRERLQEIGFEYVLMLEYIDKQITESEFIQKFIEKNWQYAKKQLIWLKRDKTIHWFSRDEKTKIFNKVKSFLDV